MKGGRIQRVLSLHCFRDSQVKVSRKQSEYDPGAQRDPWGPNTCRRRCFMYHDR